MSALMKTAAHEARRRLQRDIVACEQHIAWLDWLLTSKLAPAHRAAVEKELAGHLVALAALESRVKVQP